MDALYAAFSSGARNAGAVVSKIGAASCKTKDGSLMFTTALNDCADRIVSGEKDAVTDSLLKLLVYGATAANGAPLVPFMEHVITRMDVKDKLIRQRCCKLMGYLLACLPTSYEFPDDAWQVMSTALLARTRDKVPAVRAAGIQAIWRMQADDAPDSCPIVACIRWSAAHDSSADVRCAAVSCVNLSSLTMHDVVARAGDTAASVRAAALTRIRDHVPWARLTAHTRRRLLGHGLADGSVEVRSCATLLAAAWLGQCGWDFPTLLEGLDCLSEYVGEEGGWQGQALPARAVGAERVAESVLTALFSFVEDKQPKGKVEVHVPGADNAGDKDEEEQEGSASSGPLNPATLWSRTRDTLGSYSPSVGDCTPEVALYWRTRAAWLYAHPQASSGPGLGAGPVPLRVSSSLDPSLRAAALDSLLPDAQAWAGLLTNVAGEMGIHVETPGTGSLAGLEPSDMDIGPEGSAPSDQQGVAIRGLALSQGVPTPAALAHVTAVAGPEVDPAVPCTLRQLLLLGCLLDFGDAVGRAAAMSVLVQLLPHPSIPAWAVPLAVEALTVAAGAGQPAQALSMQASAAVAHIKSTGPAAMAVASGLGQVVPLLAVTVGSLVTAAGMAGNGGAAQDGAGQASSSSNATASLAAHVEDLRQALEEAEDEADQPGASKAARAAAAARIAGLRSQLEQAEEELAAAGPGSKGSHGAGMHHSAEGLVPISGPALAQVLQDRALELACCTLAGSNVPPAVLHATLPSLLDTFVPHCISGTGSSGKASGARLLFDALGRPQLDGQDWHGVAQAGRLLSLASVMVTSRTEGAGLSASAAPALLSLALDQEASPSDRACAVSTLWDLASAFGLRAASVKDGDGVTTSPLQLSLSLLHPLSAMGLAGDGLGQAVPVEVQAAASRGLVQALLTGAVQCDEAVCAAAWPIRTDKASSAPSVPSTSAPAVLAALFELHHALVWARATAGPASVGEEAAGTAGAQASLAGLLGSVFTAYAALSHAHKASALCAAMTGCGRMSAASQALGLDARAATFAAAGTAAGAGAAGLGDEEEDGDGDKENADDDNDGFVRKDKPRAPVPKAPAPKGPGKAAAAGAVVSDDDGGSVMTTSGGGGGSGSGMGSGAAWVSVGLQCLLSILAVSPVGKAGEAGKTGAATDMPQACLPGWAVGTGAGAVPTPASAAVAAWLSVEASAEAREAGSSAPHVPVLVAALKQVLPPSGDGLGSVMAGLCGATLTTELCKLPLKGGAVAERALRKVAESWSLAATGAAQATTGGDLAKGAVSARGAARKAELTAAKTQAVAAGVGSASSGSGVGAGSGSSSRTSSRIRAGGRATTSYADMDGDEDE